MMRTVGSVWVEQNRLFISLGEDIPSLEFIQVPAGEFWMGSDPARDRDAREEEMPQHKVFLPEYWIGKFLTTAIQFHGFIRATNYQIQDKVLLARPKMQEVFGSLDKILEHRDHPATELCWVNANAFCNWVTAIASGNLNSSLQVRLPTEAEWEKAARGSDGRIFPWGDQEPNPSICNLKEEYNYLHHTTPVGLYSPQGDSPYGCADMAGNVWEWTNSLLDPYPYNAADVPEEIGDFEKRVIKGGAYYNYYWYVRSAGRHDEFGIVYEHGYGFRAAALF